MRSNLKLGTILSAALLAGCLGGKSSSIGGVTPPPPVVNTMTVTVDSGPAAAPGQINHAYVSVKVCAPGNGSKCVTVDHVLLDTGSWGLRLVGSVLAAGSVSLSAETDAQGQAIEECQGFGGGETWGPVALADVTMAGETAANVPVQILDDTNASASPPTTCVTGTLLNDVTGFGANGLLGIGVFAQDCGAACVNPATPLPVYYGCTAAGVCTAENVALAQQVTNPVTLFAADNNGIIVNLPNLTNANGDTSVQGELIFGISTQSDNALPATGITVLGTDGSGDFTATYNGATTVLPAIIDSGTDSYRFADSTIAICSGAFIGGYYCPTVHPMNVFAVNSGVGANNNTNTVNFAIANPDITFTAALTAGASAFTDLAGGPGSTNFVWGMPFFYGRKIYIGIDQQVAGAYTGPYYAY
jgi:hypothetical protein